MFTLIDKQLLEDLQKIFPNKLPQTFIPPEEVGFLMGQQKVIDFLLNQYRLQNPLRSIK